MCFIEGYSLVRLPRGICLNYEGRVFVAEMNKNRVSVFEPDSTFAYHITGSANDGSALNRPWGVALDPKGNIHVTNFDSTNVVIFTQEGKYLSKYSCGVSKLTGIAIDKEGCSFIAEHEYDEYFDCYGKVYIFNPLHKHIHTLLNLENARGVAVDRDGYLYVACDTTKIYKY